MLKNNKVIENPLFRALESLAEQSKPNIARTAREFAVPVNRLRHRWKGGKSRFQRLPNGTKLNAAQGRLYVNISIILTRLQHR